MVGFGLCSGGGGWGGGVGDCGGGDARVHKFVYVPGDEVTRPGGDV